MKSVIIYDRDEARRAAVYREMVKFASPIPIGGLGDLGRRWPDDAWFFVADDHVSPALLQQEFLRRGIFCPIVVYSEDADPARAVQAVHRGALNYVVWPCDAGTLAQAMDSIDEVAREHCRRWAVALAARAKLSKLSAREVEVMQGICDGLSSKEIGARMGISHRTVEIHRANALAKLGARNSVSAVALWVAAAVTQSLPLAA